MGDFFYHLLQRNSLLPSVCNHFEYLSNVFFYSFAWHSNIMKADMEPTNTYRCLPDKAKPENVPMFDREDPACGKLSVWITLSGSVSKKGDTGRAAFTTFFYLRSNLSWSTRRSANTLCWLSPYKHMFLVCSGGLCCLGLCNVLFDKAVVMQTCLLEIMFVYCQISFIITLWWQKAKSKA